MSTYNKQKHSRYGGISCGHKAVCKYAVQTGVKLFLSGGLLSSDRGLSRHTFPTLEEGEPHQKKKYAPFQSQIPRFAQSREERKSNGLYGRLRKFSIKMVDCCKSFKKGALAASFKGWAGVHWVPKSKAAHRRTRTFSLPQSAFVCGTKFKDLSTICVHTLLNPYLEPFFKF